MVEHFADLKVNLQVSRKRPDLRLAEVRLKNVYLVTGPTQLRSRHRLGPLHVPLEAERCRHGAVAIPVVAVGGLIAVGTGQQRA